MIEREFPVLVGELRQVLIEEPVSRPATKEWPARTTQKIVIRVETPDSGSSIQFSRTLVDAQIPKELGRYQDLAQHKGSFIHVWVEFFGPMKGVSNWNGQLRERSVKGQFEGEFALAALAQTAVESKVTTVKA